MTFSQLRKVGYEFGATSNGWIFRLRDKYKTIIHAAEGKASKGTCNNPRARKRRVAMNLRAMLEAATADYILRRVRGDFSRTEWMGLWIHHHAAILESYVHAENDDRFCDGHNNSSTAR